MIKEFKFLDMINSFTFFVLQEHERQLTYMQSQQLESASLSLRAALEVSCPAVAVISLKSARREHSHGQAVQTM